MLNRIARFKWHLVFFLLSFFILTKFTIDPDLGWHLALGRDFLENGKIVHGDGYSWTMPGYLWANSYLGYEVIAHLLFENLGIVITTFVFGAISSLAVVLLLPGKLGLLEGVLVYIGVACLTANIAVRPHVFSFLFFSVALILLVKRFFQKQWHIFFWFLFFALWANVHPGVFFGFVAFAGYIVFDTLQQFALRKKIASVVPLWCIFAGLLGTFVTPYHFHTWESMILINLTGRQYLSSIAEWQPIAFFFPANILFTLSGVAFIFILVRRFREVPPPLFLLAAFLFISTFIVAAFLIFWIAIFIFICARYLKVNVGKFNTIFARLPLYTSFFTVSCVLVLTFAVNVITSYDLTARLRKDNYPIDALEFLEKNNYRGNLFNSYEWGGFIDWHYPEFKVFIDGRMTSWQRDGQYIFSDYMEIARGKCGAAERYPIEVVLVAVEFNALCFDSWNVVYRDDVAKVLIKPVLRI